jgi:hypothetical protein
MATFFYVRLKLCINFDKNLLGYNLGNFSPQAHLVILVFPGLADLSQTGVIAQDIQKILPDAVSTSGPYLGPILQSSVSAENFSDKFLDKLPPRNNKHKFI